MSPDDTMTCFTFECSVTTQTEKQQAVAKDTKQLRQFEENLLYNYKMYLQMLEECIGTLVLSYVSSDMVMHRSRNLWPEEI